MRTRLCLTALALAIGLAGCARRAVPYRFQAPVVSAVRAAPVSSPFALDSLPGNALAKRIGTGPAGHRRSAPSDAARPARAQPDRVPGSISAALRDLVGRREPGLSSARFAIATLAAMGASMDQRVRDITTGADLLMLADARDALVDEGPLTGDLILIEPPGDAELIVGIVVATGDATLGFAGVETAEIIYVANGTVQRGFVTPSRPAMVMDRQGYSRNSDPCHDADHPPGATRCLAGQQFRTYLRLDRLAR